MEVRAGSRGPPSAAQVRKTVTIVFADLAGSTDVGERLDPEALRDLQTRYFDAMRRALERHGGTVEKYIGDAVMAVFGIPVLHEDDALRAVRAAVEMRDSMAGLNRELQRDLGVGLELRVGINTGEVAGVEGSAGHGFVSGDAVNTAFRLQSAAPPGGVVVDVRTRRLVEGAVRLRSHGLVEVKGKRRPVRIWRVERVLDVSGRFTRGSAVPLVGRRAELRMLATRFRRAVERDRCVLVTAVGPAGMGKSRLLREFAAEVDAEATVVVGRCLPYGEGITYWPLIEIVNDLAGATGVPAIEGLLADDSQPEVVASRVAAAAGRSRASATEADVQWAVRRLFEAMARRQPLVVVFDDIHWAEPAMLDLIEHVAANAAGPILIACLARGDLLERRPGWASAGGRGSIIRLEPLSDTDSARLLGRLATRRRAKVRREEVMYAAEGNPLFLEQLVAMRADDPAVRTPPTIQALLAARIDALPQRDRRVIEAAAIEGRGFHRGAVRALVDQKRSVDAALSALVDRELIRPDRSELPGETGYRFTHILVRDAAYDLLPKRRRADLHVAYADWLLGRAERGSAAEEIVGYHLEQAYQYRSQLGRAGDERHRDLAARASVHLSDAGRRALDAGERSGAANLLGRAAALHARDDPDRAALLIDLGGVLREEGRFSESESVLREARRLAVELGDEPLEARAQVGRLLSRLQVDPDAVARLMERQGDQLAAALQKSDDAAGLARLWHLRGLLWWIRSQAAKAEDAWRRAYREAERAGDARVAIDVLGWEASSMYWGPTATAGAITRCEEIEAASAADPWARALAQHPHAGLLAMEGRFTEADRIFSDANRVLAEFGETVDAAVSHPQATSAILVGNPAAAVSHLREGRERLRRMGERAVLVGTDGYLAEALFICGDVRSAMRLTRTCEAEATADDVSAQLTWRRVRARILALRGRTAEAERLAREAVALSQSTDWITLTAEALVDLAHVLMLSGREAERRRTFREGIALYHAKGNVAGARRAAREMEAGRRSARLVSA